MSKETEDNSGLLCFVCDCCDADVTLDYEPRYLLCEDCYQQHYGDPDEDDDDDRLCSMCDGSARNGCWACGGGGISREYRLTLMEA